MTDDEIFSEIAAQNPDLAKLAEPEEPACSNPECPVHLRVNILSASYTWFGSPQLTIVSYVDDYAVVSLEISQPGDSKGFRFGTFVFAVGEAGTLASVVGESMDVTAEELEDAATFFDYADTMWEAMIDHVDAVTQGEVKGFDYE